MRLVRGVAGKVCALQPEAGQQLYKKAAVGQHDAVAVRLQGNDQCMKNDLAGSPC